MFVKVLACKAYLPQEGLRAYLLFQFSHFPKQSVLTKKISLSFHPLRMAGHKVLLSVLFFNLSSQ